MEIILLSIIAGALGVKLVVDLVRDEDSVVLIFVIPGVIVSMLVSGGLVYGMAWGVIKLAEMFGFYL